MAAQTSYSVDYAKAYDGQIADLHDMDVISGAASAEVPFGRVVSRDASAATVAPGGAVIGVGISVRALEIENPIGGGDPVYGITDAVGILRAGYIYVAATGTGTIGDALFYDDATGQIGIGVAGIGFTAIGGATLEEVQATTGAIVKIRVPSGAFNDLTAGA